ncbi:hypothetical protein KM043_011638 [Ampulex compressa]|nr:hypothetical protein KM043_011638 [Ampulex compressa]
MLESFTITLRAKSPARPRTPSFLTSPFPCPIPAHGEATSEAAPSGRQEHPHYLVLPHSPRKVARKAAGKTLRLLVRCKMAPTLKFGRPPSRKNRPLFGLTLSLLPSWVVPTPT